MPDALLILAFLIGIGVGVHIYHVLDGRANRALRRRLHEASMQREREVGEMWAALRANDELLDGVLPPDVRLPDA